MTTSIKDLISRVEARIKYDRKHYPPVDPLFTEVLSALRNRTSEPEAGECITTQSMNDAASDPVWCAKWNRDPSAHPAPATADKLRELIEAAYIAGATNVHEYWCDNPGEAPAPRDDPEFDEAASDYAFAALNEQPQ